MTPTHRATVRRVRLLPAVLLAVAAAGALAQKATEVFIPLGQSVGLSGKHTLIGRVQDVDAAARSITMRDNAATYTVRLGAQSALWVDRSPQRQPNSAGKLADVRPGMNAEVKFGSRRTTAPPAKWNG